jgi:hypothetical protein
MGHRKHTFAFSRRIVPPAYGASGPHDFAVRFNRTHQAQLLRPPTFVTIANAPLSGTPGAAVGLICRRSVIPEPKNAPRPGKVEVPTKSFSSPREINLQRMPDPIGDGAGI